MKKAGLFLVAAFAILNSFSVQAQTVDEIVAKNVEAMGGMDKINALKTVRTSGSISTQGMDFPLTIIKTHLTGMRLDLEVMGNSYYQIVTKDRGSAFMPGMQEAQVMSADQLNSAVSQLDLQGPLFNYKGKGNTVELVGVEKMDGADVYHLNVKPKIGTPIDIYIDKTTNRVVKTKAKVSVQGQDMEVENTYSDYKQNADGYWYAGTMVNMQGTITYEKYETNIPVDEKIYVN